MSIKTMECAFCAIPAESLNQNQNCFFFFLLFHQNNYGGGTGLPAAWNLSVIDSFERYRFEPVLPHLLFSVCNQTTAPKNKKRNQLRPNRGKKKKQFQSIHKQNVQPKLISCLCCNIRHFLRLHQSGENIKKADDSHEYRSQDTTEWVG